MKRDWGEWKVEKGGQGEGIEVMDAQVFAPCLGM